MQRFATTRIILGSLSALLLVSSAKAESVLSHFEGTKGRCYARLYDRQHLAKHPFQRVERISLRRSEDLAPRTRTTLVLSFRLKGSPETYQVEAYCQPRGQGARCDLESDGGSITLSSKGDNIRLDAQRVAVEGETDFVELTESGDDDVFLLGRTREAACR